jgi:hypothetical protein
MPLTFPSHAAAVLPILRFGPWRLPGMALVVGTAVPDLSYLFGVFGPHAHSARGLLVFCLPAGLWAWLWTESLLLPVWQTRVRPAWGVNWGSVLRPRGLPNGWIEILAVILALLIGSGTHILWDGFTHPKQWPAKVLYPSAFRVPLSHFLQHASTVLGAIVVWRYLRHRYRASSDNTDPRHIPKPSKMLQAFGLLTLLVLLHATRSLAQSTALLTLWGAFWLTVDVSLVLLTAHAVWARQTMH